MHPLTQDPNDDGEVHNEIARLETRIEALTESIDRCRKIALAARILIVAGGVLFALMLFGALPFARLNLIIAIATTLGGIVLLGSNSSTWNQTAAALEHAEAQRAALIGQMELRVVEERPRWLH